MKNAVLWDVTPSGFNINRRFGGANTFLRNVGVYYTDEAPRPKIRHSTNKTVLPLCFSELFKTIL
jgi:hypothetical protein